MATLFNFTKFMFCKSKLALFEVLWALDQYFRMLFVTKRFSWEDFLGFAPCILRQFATIFGVLGFGGFVLESWFCLLVSV